MWDDFIVDPLIWVALVISGIGFMTLALGIVFGGRSAMRIGGIGFVIFGGGILLMMVAGFLGKDPLTQHQMRQHQQKIECVRENGSWVETYNFVTGLMMGSCVKPVRIE